MSLMLSWYPLSGEGNLGGNCQDTAPVSGYFCPGDGWLKADISWRGFNLLT